MHKGSTKMQKGHLRLTAQDQKSGGGKVAASDDDDGMV